MGKSDSIVSAQIPTTDLARLDAKAKHRGVSRSDLVREALAVLLRADEGQEP